MLKRNQLKSRKICLEFCVVCLLLILLLVACNKLFQLTKLNLHSCSFHVDRKTMATECICLERDMTLTDAKRSEGPGLAAPKN